MLPADYLYRGLCALARAPEAGTMAGHLGAASIAGYYLVREWLNQKPLVEAIRRELDRLEAGEETIWFNPRRVGFGVRELYAPFPSSPPVGNATARLTRALWTSVDALRQSGHNVIFGSLALRALGDYPEFAREPIVAGIERLLEMFADAAPGRGYYGRERGWNRPPGVPVAPEEVIPPYGSPRAAARATLGILITHAGQRRRGYGGLFHLLTHARALLDLEDIGARELARAELPNHRFHVRLWLGLPRVDDELGRLERATESPDTPVYWERHTRSVQWSGWLTHRLKVLYAFAAIRRLESDPQRRQAARHALGYLLA